MPALSDWYIVTFNEIGVTRKVSPPGSEPWTDSFAWKDVIRVCFEPAEDFLATDSIHIFADRPESYQIPTEAAGGSELWGEIIRRGLFDAALSIKISTGQLGLTCWPPIS